MNHGCLYSTEWNGGMERCRHAKWPSSGGSDPHFDQPTLILLFKICISINGVTLILKIFYFLYFTLRGGGLGQNDPHLTFPTLASLTMEWNDGMEWNDLAHWARYDNLYPLCLLPVSRGFGTPIPPVLHHRWIGTPWYEITTLAANYQGDLVLHCFGTLVPTSGRLTVLWYS